MTSTRSLTVNSMRAFECHQLVFGGRGAKRIRPVPRLSSGRRHPDATFERCTMTAVEKLRHAPDRSSSIEVYEPHATNAALGGDRNAGLAIPRNVAVDIVSEPADVMQTDRACREGIPVRRRTVSELLDELDLHPANHRDGDAHL